MKVNFMTLFRSVARHENRKRREISHDSGILHIADKVSLKLLTLKNGKKNATVTQWRTAKTLCLVGIWAEIILRLDSYLGTTCDTPVNTFWVELQKTNHLTNYNQLTKGSHTFLWQRETVILIQRGGHSNPYGQGSPWNYIWPNCTHKQSWSWDNGQAAPSCGISASRSVTSERAAVPSWQKITPST